MKDISRIISGFKRFQEKYFSQDDQLFEQLKQNQTPKVLIIACTDSRVDPALLTHAEPGDLFVIRNVANLVPPYEPNGNFASVPAALEFGVQSLQVEHIIILGHAQCGGIHSLMADTPSGEFIGKWISIAQPARDLVKTELLHKSLDVQTRACEQASILVSLDNLMTYPWIAEKVQAEILHLHAWYFDIETGEMLNYAPKTQRFETLATS